MIRIENISVSDNIAISLCFSANHKYEYISFGNKDALLNKLSKAHSIQNDTEQIKRSFGTIIIEGLQIADSDEYSELKSYCKTLNPLINKGTDSYSPVAIELFRLYNDTDILLFKYLILKVWSEFLYWHGERNKMVSIAKSTLSKKESVRIIQCFSDFTDNLLYPIEKKICSLDELAGLSADVKVSLIAQDKALMSCYICSDTLIPLYIKTLEQMSAQNKSVKTCDICDDFFIANRSNMKACGEHCKTERQKQYSKKHRENVEQDPCITAFENNRIAYDNFRKKFNKTDFPPEAFEKYEAAKNKFLSIGKIKKEQRVKGLITDESFMKWVKGEAAKRVKLEGEVLRK